MRLFITLVNRMEMQTLGHPWSQVHVDYAGPFMCKIFLLIIDAHSKSMDIHCVNSATFSATIEKLRTTFALHGLPEFASSEFKLFLHKNGIKHITSAPYQLSSNGLVERAMHTFKGTVSWLGMRISAH